MSFYQFKRNQLVNASLDEVWDFISSPGNLKKITPAEMGFDIISDLPEKMHEGMIIGYKVKPLLGIATKWVTEITHVKEHEYFVDDQRVGPYSMWHHQHILFPAENGVLMKDIITYKPPFGLLGRIANSLVIKKKINQIFDYREIVLKEIFPDKVNNN